MGQSQPTHDSLRVRVRGIGTLLSSYHQFCAYNYCRLHRIIYRALPLYTRQLSFHRCLAGSGSGPSLSQRSHNVRSIRVSASLSTLQPLRLGRPPGAEVRYSGFHQLPPFAGEPLLLVEGMSASPSPSAAGSTLVSGPRVCTHYMAWGEVFVFIFIIPPLSTPLRYYINAAPNLCTRRGRLHSL